MENNYESFSELFPMRMTSIEKFHWLDDTEAYPNVLFTRIRFHQRIDPDLARKAWQLTIQRQPFSDVEPRSIHGRWHWVQGPRGGSASSDPSESFEDWHGTRFDWHEIPKPPTHWSYSEHRPKSPTGSYLGVFVWPNTGYEDSDSPSQPAKDGFTSEVWLYVHHAIGDGAAAVLVVNEWQMVYANLLAGRAANTGLHRFDTKLLGNRSSLGLLSWRYLKHLWKQPVALFGATKFAFRKTVELIPKSHQASNKDRLHPSIIGHWLKQETVDRLTQQAKSHDVMLNSLLIGKLYLALIRWRTKQGFHAAKDWLRIILPISIRNVSDRRLPAANRATIVQLDRREKEMENLSGFYQGINREIMVIRGWQLDKIFLIAIRIMAMFEPILKRSAQDERSRGTAVFTNLGEPLRKSHRKGSREPAGENQLSLAEFDCVGPIRKGTAANFAVSKYGKSMRVSLHFDSKLLSNEEARKLLDSYVEQLMEC